jgi:hypothetical protein
VHCRDLEKTTCNFRTKCELDRSLAQKKMARDKLFSAHVVVPVSCKSEYEIYILCTSRVTSVYLTKLTTILGIAN